MDLRDHCVEFRLSDIYLPDPLTVVYELHGNDRPRGRVVEMSDSGEREDAFVVVPGLAKGDDLTLRHPGSN
jgi:hypothetical protein